MFFTMESSHAYSKALSEYSDPSMATSMEGILLRFNMDHDIYKPL
jgi:hypothetical protein